MRKSSETNQQLPNYYQYRALLCEATNNEWKSEHATKRNALTFEPVGVESFGGNDAPRHHVGPVSADNLVHLMVNAVLHRVVVGGPRHLPNSAQQQQTVPTKITTMRLQYCSSNGCPLQQSANLESLAHLSHLGFAEGFESRFGPTIPRIRRAFRAQHTSTRIYVYSGRAYQASLILLWYDTMMDGRDQRDYQVLYINYYGGPS